MQRGYQLQQQQQWRQQLQQQPRHTASAKRLFVLINRPVMFSNSEKSLDVGLLNCQPSPGVEYPKISNLAIFK